MAWTITWTEAKRARTLQERGLDFADAEAVLLGRQFTGPTHGGKTGEERFVTAGFLNNRMVVVVWTPRGPARHIISMRYAHAKEKRLWEQKMG